MIGVKKIAVIGAESTGKSTLCEQLAFHYKTNHTTEFARNYLPSLGRNYKEDDLLIMAQGQWALEQEAIKKSNNFLFCDTDLMNIRVWSEVKFGGCSSSLLRLSASQEYDLYFLLSPDRPWVMDPLRENPDPIVRARLTQYYLEYALSFGKPLFILNGENPFHEAIEILDQFKP